MLCSFCTIVLLVLSTYVVTGQKSFENHASVQVVPSLPPSLTEDESVVRIVLVKSERDAANCWRSLLEDSYEADPWVFQNMEKKLTLERFQREVGLLTRIH